LFFDLHNRGWSKLGVEWSLSSHKVLQPEIAAKTTRLADLFRIVFSTSFPFTGFHKTGVNYGGESTSGAWVRTFANNELTCGTFEIPVAPPKGFQLPPPAQH
jgi:hypothetical protein